MSAPRSTTPDRINTAGDLLDVIEAAAFLSVGPRMVRRLITERRIPFHHVGRHVRIARNDLHNFLAAGRTDVR